MKTKSLLAATAFTVAFFALSGCDSFDAKKEGQTSVINFPEGTTGAYTIKTDFPAGSTGQLITINHKDNTGGADELKITYQVPDSNADDKFTPKDCAGFVLNFNAIPIVTKLTGIDTGGTDARTIWIEATGNGECHNTAFTLQDGGPKALALTDHAPEIRTNSGIPGFIKYGTKADPVSQWNLTGLSADVKIVSSLGYCYDNTAWNDTTQSCESTGGNQPTGPTWVQHTWNFSDGSENSYILSRTDNEYLEFIAKIETQCKTISKSTFQWKANAENDQFWKEFGIPECGGNTTGPTTPPDQPSEPYCVTETRDDQKCEVCYNENDEQQPETCWSTGENNVAEENDAKRQKDDMLKNIRDHQRNVEKEFPRIKKEMGRFQENELKKRIQKFKKLLERAGSAEKATEFLNEGISWLEERNTMLTSLQGDLDSMIAGCQSGLKTATDKVNAIVPGTSSWDDLNSGWNSIKKNLESCWPHRDSIESVYRGIEQEVYQFSDMIYEISKATIEMESYDIEVPDFIDRFFGEFRGLQKWVDSSTTCKDQVQELIKTLKATSDPEDINYAQQDVWDKQQECNWARQDREEAYEDWRHGEGFDTEEPWQRYVDRAWKTMENQRYIENDKNELEEIREALESISNLREAVRTDDKVVLKNIKNLEDLQAKALPKVKEMIIATEKGEYIEWEQLETLGNVADQSLEVIAKFCEFNQDKCSLSEELERLIYDRYQNGGPQPDFHDQFNQMYIDEELVDRIVNQILSRLEQEIANSFADAFARIFTESMADKIAQNMEGEAGAILTNIFNNTNNLGDDRTKQIVENSTEVYDTLAKFQAYEPLEEKVAAVISEAKGTVWASSLKGTMVSQFEELITAVQSGSETAAIVASIKAKFEENNVLLATEDRVQFLDSTLKENPWHYGYFMGSSFEGDGDGSGKLTGYVRPGGLINRCEALKIAIEAIGLPKAPGASDWWCDTYVVTAQKAGFRMVSGYGDTAYWVPPSSDRGFLAGNPTRAELCALWVDAGNLERAAYSNEFGDVGHLDPWAEDAATCNQNGIITGQGQTGNFDAHGLANRAEVAAMEVRFREATQAYQLIKMFE